MGKQKTKTGNNALLSADGAAVEIIRFGKKPCGSHKKMTLSYFEWVDKCETLKAAGRKQRQCKKCLHWYWKDEF